MITAELCLNGPPLFRFGPHAQAIMADIPNYTDIQPVIQISDVKM